MREQLVYQRTHQFINTSIFKNVIHWQIYMDSQALLFYNKFIVHLLNLFDQVRRKQDHLYTGQLES